MRRLLINLTSLVVLCFAVFTQPGYVLADASCPQSTSSSGQVLQGLGESGSNGCDTSGVNNLLSTVVSILSYIVGIAAIIAMLSGGLKYITSGGDANKVGNAKSTILYALIGIAIAALAQLLVHFVLYHASAVSGG